LPIFPVCKISLDNFSKRFILKPYHQLYISHHVLYGVVLPHFDAVESFAHLCVDHEKNLEVSHQLLFTCFLPGVESEGTHLALAAATVRLETVDTLDLTGFLHADQVLVETRRNYVGVGGDWLCSKSLWILFFFVDDHVRVVSIICLHGAGFGF
jgi:hypothetical protein